MPDAERLRALNEGRTESRTLSEALAVDFNLLLRAVAPEVELRFDARLGITKRMALAGLTLVGREQELARHGSDTVRGWAAFAIGAAPGIRLERRLERVRPLAEDAHFGVREWAWLAVRPHLSNELATAFQLLKEWALAESAFARRFASEATRPRGVWCSHIEALKRDPEPGLILLEPLRADESRYVQDSVANWLNDAAKTQPDWVRGVCARWERESAAPATARIVRRALRTIGAQSR
jgi:3-methyladenine DNA glycosylase AlkC